MPIAKYLILGNYRTLDFVESTICVSKLTNYNELSLSQDTSLFDSALSKMKDGFLAIATDDPAGIAGVRQAPHRDYRPQVSCAPSAMLLQLYSLRYASAGLGMVGDFINFDYCITQTGYFQLNICRMMRTSCSEAKDVRRAASGVFSLAKVTGFKLVRILIWAQNYHGPSHRNQVR
jgi:hypothetical protein